MATYNSTQAGDWDADATWAEAGHPNANDDITIVSHAVNYNIGASAITWGNITLNSGGELIFPDDANSTLLFNATGVLTQNSGSKVSCGGEVSPLDAAYMLKLHWPQGASERNVYVFNDGAELAIFGNPAYYGSEKYADLDSDWTSGQSFYVTGDRTGWVAGRKFYIHENKQYVSYQTDGHTYTVASVSAYDAGNDRTQITISEAAPGLTFNAIDNGHQSKLIMLSRNVELADPAATWGVYDYASYAERIKFDNNQAGGNALIDVRDAVLYGWAQAVSGGYNYKGDNLVFVNNHYGIYSGTKHQIIGDFVSNYYGIYYGTNHKIIGDFVSNYYGIYFGTNHQIIGDFVSNYYGIYSGTNHKIIGDFVNNYRGIYYGINYKIIGDFVNNYHGIYYGTNHKIIGDFVSNTTNISSTSLSDKNAIILEDCLLESTDRQPIRIYQNCGNWLPAVSGDAHFQAPPSGSTWILEAIPNSYCADNWLTQMELSPLNELALDVESGSQTLTVKIYPVGWASSIDQDDIVLEVRYLDSASGITRTTAVNSAATYANGAWRDLEVTFNPLQDGIVYFQVYLRKYESGCYVLIDPIPSIA